MGKRASERDRVMGAFFFEGLDLGIVIMRVSQVLFSLFY